MAGNMPSDNDLQMEALRSQLKGARGLGSARSGSERGGRSV